MTDGWVPTRPSLEAWDLGESQSPGDRGLPARGAWGWGLGMPLHLAPRCPGQGGGCAATFLEPFCTHPDGARSAEVAVSPGRALGVAEAAGPGPSPQAGPSSLGLLFVPVILVGAAGSYGDGIWGSLLLGPWALAQPHWVGGLSRPRLTELHPPAQEGQALLCRSVDQAGPGQPTKEGMSPPIFALGVEGSQVAGVEWTWIS